MRLLEDREFRVAGGVDERQSSCAASASVTSRWAQTPSVTSSAPSFSPALLLQPQRALETGGVELAALDQDLAETFSGRGVRAPMTVRVRKHVQENRAFDDSTAITSKTVGEPHESRCCERFFSQSVVDARRPHAKMSPTPDDFRPFLGTGPRRSSTCLAARHDADRIRPPQFPQRVRNGGARAA